MPLHPISEKGDLNPVLLDSSAWVVPVGIAVRNNVLLPALEGVRYRLMSMSNSVRLTVGDTARIYVTQRNVVRILFSVTAAATVILSFPDILIDMITDENTQILMEYDNVGGGVSWFTGIMRYQKFFVVGSPIPTTAVFPGLDIEEPKCSFVDWIMGRCKI